MLWGMLKHMMLAYAFLQLEAQQCCFPTDCKLAAEVVQCHLADVCEHKSQTPLHQLAISGQADPVATLL